MLKRFLSVWVATIANDPSNLAGVWWVNLLNRTIEGFANLIDWLVAVIDVGGGEESDTFRRTRPTQLTEHVADQRDHVAAFVTQRIDYARSTMPLTEDEWAVWEAGARKCYELVGVPWPGVVVKVPSPVVGALAPPIAQSVIRQLGKSKSGISVESAVRSAVDSAGRSVPSVGDTPRVGEALYQAVRDVIDATRPGWSAQHSTGCPRRHCTSRFTRQFRGS